MTGERNKKTVGKQKTVMGGYTTIDEERDYLNNLEDKYSSL